MEAVFYSQYEHRGIFIGNPEVKEELKTQSQFDYAKNSSRRIQIFRRIFKDLAESGHLALKEDDLEFLISFITLFGRFWFMEAFLVDHQKTKEEIIQHYLGLLIKQLSLFAKTKGLASLQAIVPSK